MMTLLRIKFRLAAWLALWWPVSRQRFNVELVARGLLLDERNREIAHLRGLAARRIDRALWMLVKVQAERAITRADSTKADSVHVKVVLEDDIVRCWLTLGETLGEDFLHMVGEHIARRLAKELAEVNAR